MGFFSDMTEDDFNVDEVKGVKPIVIKKEALTEPEPAEAELKPEDIFPDENDDDDIGADWDGTEDEKAEPDEAPDDEEPAAEAVKEAPIVPQDEPEKKSAKSDSIADMVIPAGFVIDGFITGSSLASLVIDGAVTKDVEANAVKVGSTGEVSGSVTCHGDVESAGALKGDIEGKNITLLGGSVYGNIRATGRVRIGFGCEVNGSIECTDADVSGSVTGDISASDSISISKTGKITGDIECKDLSIVKGGKISGKITQS